MLSNHDNPRHRTRYDRAAARAGEDRSTAFRRSEARARAAAVLLLTLQGTPFIYQGDELGLTDAVIPQDRRLDPGGRDGCRAPLPWDSTIDHGWGCGPGSRPWLPFPPEADTRNRADEMADPGAILHLYRRIIALRRSTPALSRGSFELLDPMDGVLAYRRTESGDAITVLINFLGQPVEADIASVVGAEVMLASDHTEALGRFSGLLGPDQAVVLRC